MGYVVLAVGAAGLVRRHHPGPRRRGHRRGHPDGQPRPDHRRAVPARRRAARPRRQLRHGRLRRAGRDRPRASPGSSRSPRSPRWACRRFSASSPSSRSSPAASPPPGHRGRAARHPGHRRPVPAGAAAGADRQHPRARRADSPTSGPRAAAAGALLPLSLLIGVLPRPLLDVVEPAAPTAVVDWSVGEPSMRTAPRPAARALLLAGGLPLLVLGSFLPRERQWRPRVLPRRAARAAARRGRGAGGAPAPCSIDLHRRHRHRRDPAGRRAGGPAGASRSAATSWPGTRGRARPTRCCCSRGLGAAARRRQRPAGAGRRVPAGQHPALRPGRPAPQRRVRRGRAEDLPARCAVRDPAAARRHGPVRRRRGRPPTPRWRPGCGRPRGGGRRRRGGSAGRAAVQGRRRPGHFWVPDAAQAARPAAAFLTTVPKVGALVAVSRLVTCCPGGGLAAAGRRARRGQHDAGQPGGLGQTTPGGCSAGPR